MGELFKDYLRISRAFFNKGYFVKDYQSNCRGFLNIFFKGLGNKKSLIFRENF